MGDGAIVGQEEIGDGAEALERVAGIDGDRLVVEVPAGADQREGQGPREEVVQGARRQHQPEASQSRRHALADAAFSAPQEHNGRGRAGQERGLALVHVGQRARLIEIGDEER